MICSSEVVHIEVIIDEDIIIFFPHESGWLLICETSVRLVCKGEEASRIELGSVVVSSYLIDDDVVSLTDEEGKFSYLNLSNYELF